MAIGSENSGKTSTSPKAGVIDSKLEKFKCDSNDALHFKLVRTENQVIDETNVFHPEMSHQVFGDSETIFGYNDLKVKLYYHSGSLFTYMNMSCESKVPDSYGIKPDPVLPKIAEQIPEGFVSNLDEFIKRLPEENSFTPMGSKIHSYRREGEEDVEYEVYHCVTSTPRLKEYHERLQTFILWFIDAASYIALLLKCLMHSRFASGDSGDLVERFQKKKGAVSAEYNIMGYMTVYHYFSYPNLFRPRISQMLILPPYQKKGHGVELLETVNNFYISNADAVDISVEDPSEDFVRCRDFIDCRNCQKLEEFGKEKLLKGFSDEMKSVALKKFKINKHQARRVYEILRLFHTNKSNKSMYRDYRLDVKNRLNIPYQKQARDMKKLQKALTSEEFNAAMVGSTHEERIQRLDDAFKQLAEDEYERVIKRLHSSL